MKSEKNKKKIYSKIKKNSKRLFKNDEQFTDDELDWAFEYHETHALPWIKKRLEEDNHVRGYGCCDVIRDRKDLLLSCTWRTFLVNVVDRGIMKPIEGSYLNLIFEKPNNA